MIVIADTTPLNYLVLIGESELLPTLYGGVVIPTAVLMELRSRGAPARVREWATNPPSWLRMERVDPAFLTSTAADHFLDTLYEKFMLVAGRRFLGQLRPELAQTSAVFLSATMSSSITRLRMAPR